MTPVRVYFDDEDLQRLDDAAGKEGRSRYIRRILQGEWSRHRTRPRRSIDDLRTEAFRSFLSQEVEKILAEHGVVQPPARANALDGDEGGSSDGKQATYPTKAV